MGYTVLLALCTYGMLLGMSHAVMDGDIRLVGGRSSSEGTVLVYHLFRWGAICDYSWDLRDANVACRQLGFVGARASTSRSRFGQGRRLKWMSYMHCRGNERHLTQCRYPGYGRGTRHRFCSGRYRTAGVKCRQSETTTTSTTTKITTPKPTTKTITTPVSPVRLLDSDPAALMNGRNSGYVILPNINPESSLSDHNSANVVNDEESQNRILLPATPAPTARPTTTSTTTTTTPKPTTTTTTTTPRPSTTTTTTPKSTTTTPKPTTTTTPKPTTTTPKPTTTTTPTPTTTTTTQRPTTTTTTPKPTTTTKIPTPHPTTPKPVTATPRPIAPTPAADNNEIQVQAVSSFINDPNANSIDVLINVLDNSIEPVIEETTPRPTTPKPTTTTTTTQRPTTTTTTHKPTTTPKPTSALPRPTTRRAAIDNTGSREASTRPRLRINGWVMDKLLKRWVLKLSNSKILVAKPGTVAERKTFAQYIALRKARLGESTPAPSTRTTTTTTTTTPTPSAREDEMKADSVVTPTPSFNSINDLNTGYAGASSRHQVSEAQRQDERNGLTDDNRIYSNGMERYMNGSTGTRHRHHHGSHRPSTGKILVRIAGGRRGTDGRLEVLPPGQREYGVICGDQWTFKETIVACKHLGTGYAQQNTSTSVFGGSNMNKHFYSVRCTGREENLNECQWTEHHSGVRCRRADSVAGIVCTNDLPDLEPSTYMVETTTFLQDRSLYYLTCAMEENCLSSSAYALKRNNAYGWRRSSRRLLRFSSVVRNRGTADFNPTKRRHEWDWHACHQHYHSMEIFAHYDITDLNGNLMAEGLKASFCLEDSECGRGVRPKYSCQNFGQQGISVGCSDNYMADIDCQWIDITDLKPGKYIFKIEINPSLLIAELSYDNNVIKCTLAYTGYQARIHECQLESLLG